MPMKFINVAIAWQTGIFPKYAFLRHIFLCVKKNIQINPPLFIITIFLSGCCSSQPVSYSHTLIKKASKSKSWHFAGKPITRISSVHHQFLCKCAAFCFGFFLPLLFCNRCPGSFVTELFILWAVSYWAPWIGPVFCLLFRDQKNVPEKERGKKKKMKWIPKEAKQESQREAANIRNWFTVTAKLSRWRLNANGTEQSNFRQNT